MHTLRQGFTLIELMIVIAIIAIIAAIAIPNLLESRITANETAAATSLKSAIFSGNVQYKAGTYNDQDIDSNGEYGHIGQMVYSKGPDNVSGGDDGEGWSPYSTSVVQLTLLPLQFETDASGDGDDSSAGPGRALPDATANPRSGYFFASFLPVQDGLDRDVVADQAQINEGEKYYAVVAFPEFFDDTGRRSFAITQEGQTMSAPPNDYLPGTDASDSAANRTAWANEVATAAFGATGAAVTVANRSPGWAAVAN